MAAKDGKVADKKFNRQALEELLSRRFFYRPSFEIYGAVAGFYDLGPSGCAIQANILNLWRQFFVLEEQMLEVDCTLMTKDEVFVTSGHVDRFTDPMVRDLKTNEWLRADHLLKEGLVKIRDDAKTTAELRDEVDTLAKQIDDLDITMINNAIRKYGIKSPLGNEVSDPVLFNLMFASQIGPTGTVKGYLRPETAQGMFINFKNLLEYNNGKMPFAAAQIGRAFRNEISPRSGLLRVREFTMAEIEHFVHPDMKNHPKFKTVAHLNVQLYPAPPRDDPQRPRELIRMTLGEAVAKKIIDNETLGYFLGRIYLFMLTIGMQEERLRFRQHGHNEMAHYASDCWDCEIESSYGWVECVGCADRACFDLSAHDKATKKGLKASVRLEKPETVEEWAFEPNMGQIGKAFRQKANAIKEYLASLGEEEIKLAAEALEAKGEITVTVNGEQFTLPASLLKVRKTTKQREVKDYYPSVIEPSFGIGRILYSLLEHSYYVRPDDEQKAVLSFKPIVAPIKCLVAPISSRPELDERVEQIGEQLRKRAVAYRIDDSGVSIGRRYARADELGIPFDITVDFQSAKDETATIRERDSTEQVRVPISDIAGLIADLVNGDMTWAGAKEKYPKHVAQEL